MMEKLKNKMEQLPTVTLHFIRHSIAEKAVDDSDAADKVRVLSPEGRELAAKTYERPLNMRYAHVEGSPRVRTHETAAAAAAKNPYTNPEDLGRGKTRTDEGLNFTADETTAYGRRYSKEYVGKRFMSFLTYESDTLAKEAGDTRSSTYSRMAANIADIIYRNTTVTSRGARTLEQSVNPDNKLNNFERILSTHGTIQESFLLKLVEKMHGAAARDELLALIGEKGVGYAEGFDVILSKEGGEEKIRIVFKKGNYLFDEIVLASVVKEIAEEGSYHDSSKEM